MTTNKSAPFSGRSENLYNLQFWFFKPSSEGLKRYVADSSDFEEFRTLTAWAKLGDFADIIRAPKMKIKIASYSVFRKVGSDPRNQPEKGLFRKEVYSPCKMDYACSMKIKIHSIQNLSRKVSPRGVAGRDARRCV